MRPWVGGLGVGGGWVGGWMRNGGVGSLGGKRRRATYLDFAKKEEGEEEEEELRLLLLLLVVVVWGATKEEAARQALRLPCPINRGVVAQANARGNGDICARLRWWCWSCCCCGWWWWCAWVCWVGGKGEACVAYGTPSTPASQSFGSFPARVQCHNPSHHPPPTTTPDERG